MTRTHLADLGVRTIGDLASLPRSVLQEALGNWGGILAERARGRVCNLPTGRGQEAQRSVSRETTFAQDTENPVRIRRQLSELVEAACRDLRRLGRSARTITLRLRHSDFVTRTRSRTVAPTMLDPDIFRMAEELLASLLGRRVRVRLLGIRFSNLVPSGSGFLDFDDRWQRWERTLDAVDQVATRHGEQAVRFGRSILPAEDFDLAVFLPPEPSRPVGEE